MIVLDASLVLAWLLTERLPSADSNVYEEIPGQAMLVPSHWPLELSNALRSRLATGQMSFSNFQTIMDRIGLLTIEVQEPVSIEEIGPLAQFAATHKLTTYDAAYLQLAIQCGIPLATLDRAMRTAATSLNIAIIPPAP